MTKISSLKSTWNPFKPQYPDGPDLERKTSPSEIFHASHVKSWRNVSPHAMTLSYVDINLQRTCTFSHAFQTTHWRGMLRLILMRRTCTGSRILLPAKCPTAYWWPTLGIALQRKRNLATAANKKNSPSKGSTWKTISTRQTQFRNKRYLMSLKPPI